MTEKDSIIFFENDTIQLLHNRELTIRPYLMRIKNYLHETYEMRLNEADLKTLSEWINSSIEKNNETER